MEKFKIEEHKSYDKFYHILGPDSGDMFIRIDNDDVDQNEMDLMSAKIVKILNDNWDKPEYSVEKLPLVNWFKKKFKQITEDLLNGEDAIDVSIKDNTITFSVDAGDAGIHRGGIVKITSKGVKVTLPEIIEGGGVEEDLEAAVESKWKK